MISVRERLLAEAGGNKHKAATLLVIGLMRGDADTFKQGYSFGSALIAAAEQYELDITAVGVVAELVTEQIGPNNSPTRRPLVIVHVGGGMVQWTFEKPGLGIPDVHVLDFDREGQDDEELRGFLDEIDAALEALAAHGLIDTDEEERNVRYTLGLARNEYQDHIDEGTSPSRYR